MIIDRAIAKDLGRLGFKTVRRVETDPFQGRKVDFFLLGMESHLVRLRYAFDLQHRTCRIGNLHIHPDYRYQPGKQQGNIGLGRRILQRFALGAQSHRVHQIQVESVQNDGLSFWPRMGATPTEDCTPRLRRALFNVIAHRHSYQHQDVARVVHTNERLKSGASAQEIWPSISAKPEHGGLSNGCLARITNQTLGDHANMVLRLKDPVVLQRLGLTPP